MRTNNLKKQIVLDTHAWIWLINGDKRLEKSKCRSYIEDAAKSSNICVSAISVWEIGMLESKSRIKFSINCLDWINKALSAPGISLAPITPEIAIESSRLPGKFHGDPADRIIVATARKLEAKLITYDKNILSYGEKKFLRVIPI
jgi:PIN domain nuclease of toxin-antitoxin system